MPPLCYTERRVIIERAMTKRRWWGKFLNHLTNMRSAVPRQSLVVKKNVNSAIRDNSVQLHKKSISGPGNDPCVAPVNIDQET